MQVRGSKPRAMLAVLVALLSCMLLAPVPAPARAEGASAASQGLVRGADDVLAGLLGAVDAAAQKAGVPGRGEAGAGTAAAGGEGRAEKGADDAELRAEHEAAARNRGVARSSDPDVWNVHYTVAHGTATAADDGSVTQWQDGYYIAHDWSDAGKKIAAHTPVVVVDGRSYGFADSMNVSSDTYYEQVEGWAHENGSIAFQTCIPDGYMICRYEPLA